MQKIDTKIRHEEEQIMNTDTITDDQIDRLAWAIERDGLGIVDPSQIDIVARHGRAHGASPVLVDVLADSAQPTNARTRAFGLVALQASRRAA